MWDSKNRSHEAEKPLRIAINAVNIDLGGGVTGLRGYLSAWRELELPVVVDLVTSRSAVAEQLRPLVDTVRGFAQGLPSAVRYAGVFTSLGPILQALDPQVVWSVNFAVPRCNVPQVVHHRNLLLFDRQLRPIHAIRRTKLFVSARLAMRALRRRDVTHVFLSQHMLEVAREFGLRPESPAVVIHNGVRDSILDQDCNALSRERTPVVLNLTSEEPHKDTHVAVRVLGALRRIMPNVNWRLVVAGQGAYFRERELANDLGVSHAIDWVGFASREKVDHLLRTSFCLLYPSRCEGFGNPPLEAMALGCPVIATRAAAIPEVVGTDALLCGPGDVEEFARSVVRLWEDDSLRSQLFERGKQRAKQFRWTESARKMFDTLSAAAVASPSYNPR